MNRFEKSVVRIVIPSDDEAVAPRHVGMGVLVARDHVMTCCHVVNDACGRTTPGEVPSVMVEFPYANGERRKGTLVAWGLKYTPRIDAAVVVLDSNAPEDSVIATFTDDEVDGRHAKCVGWDAKDAERFAPGHFSRLLSNGLRQFDGPTGASVLIAKGYSGTPVWCDDIQAFAGMVTEVDNDQIENRASYLIPSQLLRQIWPNLLLRSTQLPTTDESFKAVNSFLYLPLDYLLPLGYFAGIAAVTVPLNPFIPEGWRWIGLAVGIVILIAAGAYHWWERANQTRVRLRRDGRRPGYFRLVARDQADLDSFFRQDECQSHFVDWIKRMSAEPVLYVIGRSGVGKSSLVNAYAIPQLTKQGWLVVSLEISGDLRTQLRERLQVCWKQPPKDIGIAPIPNLLERAADLVQKQAERATGGKGHQPAMGQNPTDVRILVVLDQFDQLLAMAGKEPDRIRVAVEMLEAIRKEVPKRVTVLVVLREDLIPAFECFTRAHGLLEIAEPGNVYRVMGFTLDAAREYLQGTAGGLDFDSEFLDRVVKHLNKLEGGGGVIRPITLNMYGWYLQRFVLSTGPASTTVIASDPIHDFVRQAIGQKAVREQGPVLLKAMITDRKSTRRRGVSELADELKFAPAEVRACLLALAAEGLVRRVGGDEWEVAHDILAEVLADVLDSSSVGAFGRFWKTKSQAVRPWYTLYDSEDVRRVLPSGETVLHVAIRDSDDSAAVRHILDVGADVNAVDAKGDTAFHHAAREGKAGLLEELSKWTNGIDFRNYARQTPLHVAAAHGQDNCVALLLAFGSDVTSTDCQGKSPLHLAAAGGHLRTAERLMSSTPPPDPNARDEQNRTALHDAVATGGREMVDWLLARADPNVWAAGGVSPLREAAANDDPLLVEILLTHPTHPADPNVIPEHLDFAPLHVAALHGAARATRSLLDNGANPNLPNRDDGFTPLHIAARHDQRSVAEALLSDPRTELNPIGLAGTTPLYLSAQQTDHCSVGELLLSRGADPNVGHSPLNIAIIYRNYKLARVMLERGADPNCYQGDMSPLTVEAVSGRLESVELLLRHGADASEALEAAEDFIKDPAILEAIRRAAAK